MMVVEIKSGGQTGADLAGLLCAEILGIKTTGVCPKGGKTEKGDQPLLFTRFGLTEHHSRSYLPRTEINARDSDATIILSPNRSSSGTKKTIEYCLKHDKQYIVLSELNSVDAELLLAFLIHNKPKIINIAGNRESVAKGLTRKGRDFLVKTLKIL
jgi:hypothetical protein